MVRVPNRMRNEIVVAVAGGLLTTFILWLMRKSLPAIWSWISHIALWSWGFLTSTVPVPLWILGILFVVIVLIASVRRRKAIPRNVAASSVTSPALLAQPSPPVALSDIELEILRVLVATDGNPPYLDQLASAIDENRIRTKQALEELERQGYVDFNMNYVYGSSYYLTSKGRAKVIELGFA